MSEFEPHEIEWSEEKIGRFWDFLSAKSYYFENNFAAYFGDHLIRLVHKYGFPKNGEVLDFGCGPGLFIEKLLKTGYSVYGAELSAQCVSMVKTKFRDQKNFRSIQQISPESFPAFTQKFDALFLLETIEHIVPEKLNTFMEGIVQLIKPQGWIVITTPNDENLEALKIICPDCGAIMHSGQHLSTWTKTSLENFMKSCGFESVMCQPVFLRKNTRFLSLKKLLSGIGRHKKSNLVYIGRKFNDSSV